MERFRDVLLDVWREVCRHIEIRESAGTIAEMLANHLPLACLLVRRLDGQHQTLETVAVGQPVAGPLDATVRTPLTPAKHKRLLAWANAGELLHVQRMKRSGTLDKAEHNYNWRGDDIGYAGIHRRLMHKRGKAKDNPCLHCGTMADDWSYNHTDPNERTCLWRGRPAAYSLNLAEYDSLCRSCHSKRDRRYKRRG